MKKGLLATTALAGASVFAVGVAAAAEAPTYSISGYMKFQAYWIDQDRWGSADAFGFGSGTDGPLDADFSELSMELAGWQINDVDNPDGQDHDWYFGMDDAEITLKVKGAADNGLNYSFKIEFGSMTSNSTNADEARIQFDGSWGTLQLGDEDGAEDIMNYGAENLIGAAGGWDGDIGDGLTKGSQGEMRHIFLFTTTNETDSSTLHYSQFGGTWGVKAPGGPSIAGDSGDDT